MYKILGNDHQIYGPASAVQIRQWVAEGRVNAATMVLAEGETVWKPLGSIPEFAVPPIVSMPAMQPRQENSAALAGLVFGILANMCCCIGAFCAILGIIFSCVALSRHHANPQIGGKGKAIAGLILSVVGLCWHMFPFFIGVPPTWWFGHEMHFRHWR